MPLSIVWRDSTDPDSYEEARTRRLFNRDIPKRYPIAVVYAGRESDIVDAVKLAIEKGCRVSVLSGGHSFPAWSIRDDAILLDLGNYTDMAFDQETGIVSASPSTTGHALNEFLIVKNRMFQVGHCPEVGIGGFLLAGGMGWNCNNWGWSSEQIVAIDAVTASGNLIQANAQQNSDLLWAAKGAGPGFPGIVTRFHLQTRPAPKVMRSSRYVYAMKDYTAAFSWILQVPFTDEDGVEAIVVGSYPSGMEEPCLTIALVGFGEDENTVEEGLQKAEKARPPGSLTHSVCTKTNLGELLESKAKAYPQGYRYCVDNAFLKNGANVVSVLELAFTTLPTKTSQVFWTGMKPCSRRQLPDMALSLQSDHFFALYAIWSHEGDDSNCKSWAGNVMKTIDTHSVGAYVGEFDFQVRRSKVWGNEQAKTLTEIQRRWDPDSRICGCLGLEDLGDADLMASKSK
ncbi:hypothetical protein ACJ72_03151 [Emergomyces africanus]|uniref:FAD-binding PCMH-type domain-containing protein n=1 Tax=Emergomyces africanus TaxID=1955775 RepID=A0A1B7P0E2_9EURO|nr:hypothetical protein ACJ72_03151 [Emergomyces africanus]